MVVKVHPSAVVDNGADIGDGTSIWHFSHVCSGASIGRSVTLGQNVFVGGKAIIGNNCKVQNNVSIYDSVEIREDVFCGPSVVFTNVYNPRAFVERKNEYRKTVVEKGVTLGANTTIVCGVTIGEYAFVGAGSLINRDVKPYALVVGVPSRQIGWVTKFGERIRISSSETSPYICRYTGEVYWIDGHKLIVHKK